MQLKIAESRLREMKVWILVPAAGDLIHATFSNCLLGTTELLRAHGIASRVIYLPGDSLVTRARNNLAQIFLKASSDDNSHFCLWLDCDILFDPQSVLQLLALDMDFVSAPYSKKGLHGDRMAEAARLSLPNDRMLAVAGTPNVNWLTNPVLLTEPMPVLESGTGFWLLKRKVFTQMIAALPHIKYRRSHEEHAHYGEDGYDFFRVGVWPETGEYLSEDWWFCREWRRLGGTVYCCFWIKTNHIGPYLYPMDMPAIADLLAATGGYINGPTKEDPLGPTASAGRKETTDAPTQVRPIGPTGIGVTGVSSGGGNGHATPHDIARAVRALRDVAQWTPDEATIEGHPGAVGD